jgi:hypothetical protein
VQVIKSIADQISTTSRVLILLYRLSKVFGRHSMRKVIEFLMRLEQCHEICTVL